MFNLTHLFDLTGRIALVTGSSRGLGYAMAQGLAEAGATIILNGRNLERLAQAQEEFIAKGYRVYVAPFDVTDSAQIQEAIVKVTDKIGDIDILVNNAGIQYREPLEDFDEEQWRRVLDVNVNGVFLTTKAVVASMIERKSGKIINIASLMSETARRTIGAYTASKGAVKQLTKSMATEWAVHNIQANAIAPGYFLTELNEALVNDTAFNEWVIKRTPAARWGKPQELVGVAVFLASDASNFINGQTIIVDGGILATV